MCPLPCIPVRTYSWRKQKETRAGFAGTCAPRPLRIEGICRLTAAGAGQVTPVAIKLQKLHLQLSDLQQIRKRKVPQPRYVYQVRLAHERAGNTQASQPW